MILEDVFVKKGQEYDRSMEASDWRYSATIVGMIRFFDDYNIKYHIEGRRLYYNYDDIYHTDAETDLEKDRNYLLFAEDRFKNIMHHISLKNLLRKEEFSKDDIKEINQMMAKNTVMKKVFKNIKFDTENMAEIERLIDDNRLEIIKETFKNSPFGYRKYINNAKFRSEAGEICRLLGFYVDTGRKTKSLGFCFDKDAKDSNDCVEFDYLPFGFSLGATSIFVNNNISIERLLVVNKSMDYKLEYEVEKGSSWNTCFYNYSEGSIFIDYDVEVIEKNNSNEFYETVFIRKSAIDIFEKINQSWKGKVTLDQALRRFIKLSDDYYINIIEEVTSSILNGKLLDDLIESLLKLEYHSKNEFIDTFLTWNLIQINEIIYYGYGKKEEEMGVNTTLKASSAAALQVVKYFKANNQENKIKGYRQRLASALVAKDYDRFTEVVLQLSSYTEIAFPFMHTLIGDFEANKNLAYDFVNSLIELKMDTKKQD